MGAGPSLGKFLKSMDDEELATLMESAYKLEPQRMDKVFTLAKLRYFEEARQQVDAATELSISAALLPTPPVVTSSPAPPTLSEMLPTTSAPATIISSSTVETAVDVMADEQSALTGVKDPMNALWTFDGHPLRELQTADKNPQNGHTGEPDQLGNGIDPALAALGQRGTDADGFPVMYGSCGRDKRYGRCSVCYFRGLRCNTAYYCACCQRSVCIRPRKYPGEEHQKICWNVLHMDKDMVQRVEKKKKRKLHATATSSVSASAVSRLQNAETCNTGEADNQRDRQNDSLSHEDLHQAPSIPTVVADVSGAVDL